MTDSIDNQANKVIKDHEKKHGRPIRHLEKLECPSKEVCTRVSQILDLPIKHVDDKGVSISIYPQSHVDDSYLNDTKSFQDRFDEACKHRDDPEE